MFWHVVISVAIFLGVMWLADTLLPPWQGRHALAILIGFVAGYAFYLHGLHW